MNGFRFGVEIEFTGATCDAVTRYLSDNGVNIYYAGYSHSVSDQWKVVTDASVTVGGIGGELVSPILSGVTGLFDLDRVVQILNEVPNIGVDRRCGLHVHVSWDGMTVAQVQTIVNRFTKYEDWFDSIQPVSRRANRFCKAVKGHPQFSNALAFNPRSNYQSLQALGHIASDRYVKLNLASLSRYGTIEFRQHSGTTDPVKVVNWVRFLEQFIDASLNPSGSVALDYKRRSQRAYAEIREQFEAVGAAIEYKGGQWKITTPSGAVVKVPGSFLDSCYEPGTRKLNEFFAEFFQGFIGSADDHVFSKVAPELVQYFNARQARFA